jgi:PAS domain S-box-containing protein
VRATRGAVTHGARPELAEATAIVDEAGRIVGWNHAAAQLFGWPAEGVLGRPALATLVSAGQRELFEALLDALTRETGAPGVPQLTDLRAVRRDGRGLRLEASLSRIDLVGGEVGILLVCRPPKAPPRDQHLRRYRIDTRSTHLAFSCAFMKFFTVHGEFRDFAGWVDVLGDDLTSATAECVINASSVDTRNIERDSHLRSPDFFAVDRYPELTYRSRSVLPLGDGHFRVLGDLTIRDVTREMTLDVRLEDREIDDQAERVTLTATSLIRRSDWLWDWDRVLQAGRWMVGNEVRLDLVFEVVRQQDERE